MAQVTSYKLLEKAAFLFIIQLVPKLGTTKREIFVPIAAYPPWNTEIRLCISKLSAMDLRKEYILCKVGMRESLL